MPRTAGCITDIVTAYRLLAAAPGDAVPLTEIRSHRKVSRYTQDQVSASLIELWKQSPAHVYLLREMNQKTLTKADHAAAVVLGDTPKHKLAIQ
jgi:hypothetical protein